MWGRPELSCWEHTEMGFCGLGACAGKNNFSSQLLAPLWFDTCPTLWQNLQTGCSHNMCKAKTSARKPEAEKSGQYVGGPTEASEYSLKEDGSSEEPPGQQAMYKHCLKPKVLIPWAETFHIVQNYHILSHTLTHTLGQTGADIEACLHIVCMFIITLS